MEIFLDDGLLRWRLLEIQHLMESRVPPSWVESYVPQNSYIEALTPNVTVFGDKLYKQVIKVKWGCKAGALIQQD